MAAVGAAGAAIGKRRAEQQAAEAEPQQEPASPTAPDYSAELENLAKLRDDGLITAEDYEAKKKQLLGI